MCGGTERCTAHRRAAGLLQVLLALPQPPLPLPLPAVCPSLTPAPWAGWKAARWGWMVEYKKRVNISLSCPNASHSFPALLSPKCLKGWIIPGQEVYQSLSLSLDDRGAQIKLAQGRLVAILFQIALPACSKFWVGDLLHQSW